MVGGIIMKKVLLILLIFLALCTACLGLAGCDYTTGEIGKIDYDPRSQTIFWEPVSGADNYTVFENGKRLLNTNDTKFFILSLKEDVSYITIAPTKHMKDMGLSEEYLFISKGYEGIEYTLMEDKSGYEAVFSDPIPAGAIINIQSIYKYLPVKSAKINPTTEDKEDNYKIVVPDTIEKYDVFSPNGRDEESVIRLPQSLKEAEYLGNCVAYQINTHSENYTVRDGVLYDKKMETLVWYPSKKIDQSFTVPKGVKSASIAMNVNLKNIKLLDGLEIFYGGFLNLENIDIPRSVREFGLIFCTFDTLLIPSSVSDVHLYLIDAKKIIFEYGTEVIKYDTICFSNDLDIYIPETVHTIER